MSARIPTGEPQENVDEYLLAIFIANGQGTEEFRNRVDLARSAFPRTFKKQGLLDNSALYSFEMWLIQFVVTPFT